MPTPNIDTSRAPKSLDELRSANDAAVDELAKLPRFDGRDYGIVTPVRSQIGNICWAYAVTGAAETSVLREGIDPNVSFASLDLNDRNLACACLNPALDPLGNNLPDYHEYFDSWSTGGETHDGVYAMLRWNAPALQSVPITEPINDPAYLLENAVNLPGDEDALKRAIVKYGGVAAAWYCNSALTQKGCYNNNLSAGLYGFGHASVIVGWDDSVDKNRFYYDDRTPCPASRDGAWILKNSWGAGCGFSGYYYVSYDVLLSKCYALDMCSPDEYDNNYHYDSAVTRSSSWTLDPGERAAAMFESRTAFADRRECITGVNVAVGEGGNYKIKVKIYKNSTADFTDIYSPENDPESGELAAEAESDLLLYPGAYTVKLEEPVELEQNQVFSVVVELTDGAKIRVVTEYEKASGIYLPNDMTFSDSGEGWTNTRSDASHVAQIKVLTKNLPVSQHKGKSLDYADIRFDRRAVTYNQTAQHPELTVYFDGEPLTEGQDYTVDYPDSVRVGRFSATVTGIGDYSGSRDIDYSVKQAPAPLNKPPRIMEVTGNYETYADVPLPDGWGWGVPDMPVASEYSNYAIYKGDDADCYVNTMADVRAVLKNE